MTNPVEIKQVISTTKSWAGVNLPGFGSGKTEMRIVHFKIAPGAKTSVHLHPLNGAGYIISGELTMYSTEDTHGGFKDHNSVKEITLKAGEAWAETVNMWHYGENKGDKEVEFIVAFAGLEGTPSTLSLDTKLCC